MRIIALALALIAIVAGGILSVRALAGTPLVEIYVDGHSR
jgi:hypothetical protein